MSKYNAVPCFPLVQRNMADEVAVSCRRRSSGEQADILFSIHVNTLLSPLFISKKNVIVSKISHNFINMK